MWEVLGEVSYSHFATQNDGYRSRKQSEKQQQTAEQLQTARKAKQGHEMNFVAAEHSKEFLQTVKKKREARYEAQNTQSIESE